MAQTARVDASNGGANSRRLQLTNKEPVSNTEHRNHHFTFPRAGKDFFLDPYIRENGSNSPVASQNQGILEELRDYIRGSEHYPADNNNKGNSVPNKMATSSTSGSNQATVNANGFEMTMNSSPGLANKSRAATTLGSAHLNNQLSSILGPGSSAVNAVVSSRNLSQSNSNPTNLKLLATNQPSVTPQDRFNRYNPRQEMLLHGFREVPIAPRAPNVSEQYGSQQGFVSAQSENQQKRGLNPQTPSPYSPAYYGQDSSTSQTGQRTVNSQPDDRNMITNQQFQWQNRLQTSNHCSSNLPTNSSPGPPMGRTQLQSGIPQQQSPYMMMGNSQQQSQSQQTPPPSYPPYMMQQGGMKAAGMPPQSQQYYGSMAMGRPTVGQPNLAGQVAQRMGGQMPKPSQDYSGFQQQQMQHRYPQPQFPQQMQFMTQPQPRQQQQQQQSYPQPPTGMPRMPSSHPQPILPKPASGDMFGRYSTNNTSENLPGQEFGSTRMAEHPQHAMPSTPASYGNPPLGRMGSSSEMLSKYGSTQGGYSRGNPPPFPGSIHARHTPSPNVTLGSPLRNVSDGTSPSVGMPNFGQDSPTSTGSMPTYPPGKLAPPFVMPANQMSATNSSLPSVSVGGSGLGGPGAAAVAGVLEGVNSGARFPSPAQVSGSPYVSPQEMIMGSKVSENTTPSGMSPMQLGSMMGNVQTGRVPSPTLNELPTAEDVEAMIESMRAGETSLPTDNGEQPPLQGSAPPSVGSLPPTMESSPSRQQVSTAHGQNSSGETQQHSSNSNLDMSAMMKEDQSGSPQTSPLSTFSGLSPGVSPSGVSITSSFDDLDEINPSLPNNPISMSSYQFPSSREPQQQYEKFSKLYEVSDELERKEFLDKYQAFMNSQGTQITQVPAFQRQPLDLYKFYTAVRERGGVQEVVRRKLWQDVLEELNLPTDSPSIVNVLRIQYSRYLLSYEMKHTKTNSLDDIKINLLEGSGIPPPNATVTCSEAIIPSSSLTQSQRPADASSVHASHGSMKIESSAGLPAGYNSRDGFAEPGFDNSNLFLDLRDMTGNFQLNQSTSSNTFGMPQYPYSGDNRRHSVPNLPQGALPSYMMSQRNMYPNPSSMSPFFQQSSSQTGHPPAANFHHSQYQQRASPSFMGPPSSPHSMIPNASSQEKVHPSWGSQYSPSTEPEHMVDYPPGAHSLRSPRLSSSHQPQFPPAPPYGSYPSRQQGPYSAATPPYRPIASPSPSSRQQAMAQSMQAAQKAKYQHQQQLQSQQQQQQPQAHTAAIKRDATFPPDCVEASRPVFTKKRKLTSRDLGPVEAWRVMMSLKSGLLSEATWALDTLNILLYDDNTVTYFMLAQLPGLLDNLIDHFRRYLVEIFDTFGESEIDVGTKVVEQRKEGERECVKGSRLEEGQLEIEKVNLNAKRSFTSVLVGSTFEFSKEGFQSGASDWLMGGGDTTLHIQTHIGSMPGRDFVESSELKGVERRNNTTDIKKETDNTRFSELEESEAFCEDVFCSGRKKCLSNCGDLKPFSTCPAFKEDFDSKTEVSVKREESSTKALEAEKSGDTCGSQQEELFTKRLKKELDLDFDSETEDSESDRYIQTEVVSKINVKRDPVIEEQSCGKEDAPLCLRTESQDAVSRRCLCVSNILRGLSFVPGNDAEMSRHAGLLLIVGRLLLLHHQHAKRVPYRHSYLQDEVELECPSDDRQDWWWYCLEGLRENALVITANVAGQLDMSLYPEAISAPLLDGLLHWFVCPSAAAQDPMPTATPGTSLSPRQLALEALAKMSILESNVDMMLSSPPLTRVEELYAMLVRLVGERGNPVTRELALVLLSNLAQGENSFVGFGDSKACISMLLEFIEDAATNMSAYSSGSALAQAGFHSENFCGTSVDMLRRAASTLVCLARIRSNRALFLPFQQRVLRLAIMRILDNMITSQLAEILFYLSR